MAEALFTAVVHGACGGKRNFRSMRSYVTLYVCAVPRSDASAVVIAKARYFCGVDVLKVRAAPTVVRHKEVVCGNAAGNLESVDILSEDIRPHLIFRILRVDLRSECKSVADLDCISFVSIGF